MSKIRFQILPPIRHPEEPIVLTGGIPALGEWQPERGLRLRWEAPWHVGEVEADTGASFDYKITRGSWQTEEVDAHGNVPGNRSHTVWLDATLHHTVADWKDRYRGRLTSEPVHSRELAGWRNLMIRLPQSYATEPERRFPLIVLHDGANVFDPLTSPISGVDWAADEWVNLLSEQGVLPEAIVAGVCHPEGFTSENHTLRDHDLSPELGGAAYAQFVATELVAHMDTHYRTLPEPAARILGGASLGGLLSFYVARHHPGVFGRFACLSTAFEDVSENPPVQSGPLLDLEAAASLPPGVRMSFDYGTTGLDECYEPYHRQLGSLLREKGWRDGWEFRIARVSGGSHSELSWRQRFGDALRFLAQ